MTIETHIRRAAVDGAHQTPLTDRETIRLEEITTIACHMQGIAFVAGGAARFAARILTPAGVPLPPPSMFDRPGDIDLFLYNKGDWNEVRERLVEAGYKYRYSNRAGSQTWELVGHLLPVQIVSPYANTGGKSGHPDAVIQSFGLTIEQFALQPTGNGSWLFAMTAEAIEADQAGEIVPTGAIDPVFTLRRMTKYLGKGFTIGNEDAYLNILDEWLALTDTQRAEIRDRVAQQGEDY